MARHKRRSVALFEVIHKDKRYDRHSGALPTPAWWYKGKLAGPPPAVHPTPAVPPSAHSQSQSHSQLPSQPPPQSAPPLTRQLAPSMPRAKAKFRAANELPLTRMSAAIIAAAVVIVLTLGILWTRWSHRAAALSPSAAAILAGPAHPEVLDIAGHRTVADQTAANNALANNGPSLATDASSVQTPARQPGQGYVLIHAYLTSKSATEARDTLNQQNVPCTIERGLPGVAAQEYALVGLEPFVAIGTPQYTAYIQKIKTILNSRIIRPHWIKWPSPALTG